MSKECKTPVQTERERDQDIRSKNRKSPSRICLWISALSNQDLLVMKNQVNEEKCEGRRNSLEAGANAYRQAFGEISSDHNSCILTDDDDDECHNDKQLSAIQAVGANNIFTISTSNGDLKESTSTIETKQTIGRISSDLGTTVSSHHDDSISNDESFKSAGSGDIDKRMSSLGIQDERLITPNIGIGSKEVNIDHHFEIPNDQIKNYATADTISNTISFTTQGKPSTGTNCSSSVPRFSEYQATLDESNVTFRRKPNNSNLSDTLSNSTHISNSTVDNTKFEFDDVSIKKEESDDVIIISDSEDEQSTEQENVSSINPSNDNTPPELLSSTVWDKLNRFFDNVSPHPEQNTECRNMSEETKENTKTNETPQKETINISASININIRITTPNERVDCASSTSTPKVQSSVSQNIANSSNLVEIQSPQLKPTPIKSFPIFEKNNAKTPKALLTPTVEAEFHTPIHPNSEDIDYDAEKILTELYGNSWKTPEAIKIISTTKKYKKPDIRKETLLSRFSYGFKKFENNLGDNLNSTAITPIKPINSKPKNENVRSSENNVDFKKPDSKSNSKPIKLPNSNTDSKENETGTTNNPIQLVDSGIAEPIKTPVESPYFNKKHIDSGSKSSVKKLRERKAKPKYFSFCDTDTESERSENDASDDEWEGVSNEGSPSPDIKHRRRTVFLDLTKDVVLVDKDQTLSQPHESPVKSPEDKMVTTPNKTKDIKTKRKLFTADIYDLENSKNSDDSDNINSGNIRRSQFRKPSEKEIEKSPGLQKILDNLKPININSKLPLPSSKLIQKQFSFLKSLEEKTPKLCCDPLALDFRDNFKRKKYELAEHLFQLYNSKIFDNGLNLAIKWNKRLTRTAGRCRNKRNRLLGSRLAEIELSEKVLSTAERLRCTLIHELCHAAAWIYDGASGHGSIWQKWCNRVAQILPDIPKITVCHNYDIEFKYTYKCKICNTQSHCHSKSKKVTDIRCSKCHGAIEILLNKKNKNGELVQTPVREASGFAKFVKDHYSKVKTPFKKHADVMKELSSKFADLNTKTN